MNPFLAWILEMSSTVKTLTIHHLREAANLGIQRQNLFKRVSAFLTWYSLCALALFDPIVLPN